MSVLIPRCPCLAVQAVLLTRRADGDAVGLGFGRVRTARVYGATHIVAYAQAYVSASQRAQDLNAASSVAGSRDPTAARVVYL